MTTFVRVKTWFRRHGFPIACGVLGSGVTGITITLRVDRGNPVISYPDLAATLLAAVGVIVAIFGGLLALAALWGFSQMKEEAKKASIEGAKVAATEVALEHLKAELRDGELRNWIRRELDLLLDERIDSKFNDPSMAALVEGVVQRQLFGNPLEDSLLEDDHLNDLDKGFGA